MRPAIGVSRWERARPRARLRDAVELVEDEAERSAGDEHRRCVHHVLGRRTQVHPAAVLLPDTFDESAHQRLDGGADPLPFLQQLLPVVAVAGAGRGDRGRRRLGDGSRESAGAREGGLGGEHRREPRAPRHGLPQLVRDEERRERAHTAKNVVWPGPCRRMSKRRPPSSADGDERRASRLVQAREHRIGGVRLDLVGEVEPRDGVLEQATREDPHLEVRCLEPALRARARGRA